MFALWLVTLNSQNDPIGAGDLEDLHRHDDRSAARGAVLHPQDSSRVRVTWRRCDQQSLPSGTHAESLLAKLQGFCVRTADPSRSWQSHVHFDSQRTALVPLQT